MVNRFCSSLRIVLLLSLYFISQDAFSQDVMMQGWYWDYPKTSDGESWTDTLDAKVTDLASKGFTHVWLPPLSRASFGSNSNGYDPKDLFDLGEFGLGPTGFGTRSQVDGLIANIKASGMKAVADVVYNHRDGGVAESNTSVRGWIENYNCTKKNSGDNPYPSDRFRMILPLGGSSMNGAGTYYFKIASASKHPDFHNKAYKFYCETNTKGFQNLPADNESEPNGGGDCGQGNNAASIGVDMLATIDNSINCGSGTCGVDEFAVTINAADFDAAGDTLYIYMTNPGGDYTDHDIYAIWNGSRGADVESELTYQTYTDFTSMPSGRGGMNYLNFKPNGNPTNLNGDWDAMLFFYDYDQGVSSTRDTLIEWTKWLVDDVDIEGLRMDAVKHFDYNFVADLLDSLYLENKVLDMVVGEFFDFNPSVLKGWVDNVENNMLPAAATATDVKIFDFALRGALKNACDQFGYDARDLFDSGIVEGAGGNKNQVVTFANNHDFRGPGEPILNDPELAYAYLLTNPNIGTPSIFYPDYYGTDLPEGPDAKLKGDIDVLLDIKKDYIDNATSTLYISENGGSYPNPLTYIQGAPSTSVIYEVVDDTNLLETIVAINFSGDTLEVQFKWAKQVPGATLELNERTGKGLNPSVNIAADSTITLVVLPRSYGIWSTDDLQSICGFGPKIYVDKSSTGGNNGSSWADAFTSLHAAMRLPSACSNIEEIWVKEGEYRASILGDRDENFQLFGPIDIYGGFPSSVPSPIFSDRDWVAYPTTLNGDLGSASSTNFNHHVLTSFSFADTSLVDGFILKNGNADGSMSLGEGGGLVNLGSLLLSNCKIENCAALGQGSAIYNSAFGTLLLNNTTVENVNTSSSSIYNGQGASISVIEDSFIKK